MSGFPDIISSWTTSEYPTSTYLKSINPTVTSALSHSYSSALERFETETEVGVLVSLSRVIRGVEATATILSAQDVLATATNDAIKAEATEIIFKTSVNLDELNFEYNLYETFLSRPANIIYLTVFSLLFLFYTLMSIKSRYLWFNITFFCGYALEMAGFIGRVLSFTDWLNDDYYLLQFVSLTIAPAFIMAGIYFTFAQLVVIHGRHYSVLKPMWYTYLFITFDILSLVIQAIGGGIASVLSIAQKDTAPGTNTMIAGIVFQVVSMSIFLGFWFEFLHRLYFKDRNNVPVDSPYKKRSVGNAFKFLLNTEQANAYKNNHLDPFYNGKYRSIRTKKLLNYMPLAVTIASIAVFIRCVYRVVELAQGWSGYLINHEVFLMTLDALMISIAGIIFVIFHPYFVFGAENVLKVSTIKNRLDHSDNSGDEKSDTEVNSLQPISEVNSKLES